MSIRKFALFAIVIVLATFLLSACAEAATTTASCAFIVGDGRDGNDANVHEIAYPGERVIIDVMDEDVYYVPCNSRNYIINKGVDQSASGAMVGDRHNLIEAYTRTGAPVYVGAKALWTLNQSEEAMMKFWNVCHKYNCASNEDVAGDLNYATAGWNDMLGENFGSVMDKIAQRAMMSEEIDDTIWKNHNADKIKILEDKMSEYFADEIRRHLGYPEDLFCGSGNSSWDDPTKPGEGNFTCSPVRIIVDSVDLNDDKADISTEGLKSINEQRYLNAKELYGEYTPYWLGLHDAIGKCQNSGVNCVFNLGNPGGAIAIPMEETNVTP